MYFKVYVDIDFLLVLSYGRLSALGARSSRSGGSLFSLILVALGQATVSGRWVALIDLERGLELFKYDLALCLLQLLLLEPFDLLGSQDLVAYLFLERSLELVLGVPSGHVPAQTVRLLQRLETFIDHVNRSTRGLLAKLDGCLAVPQIGLKVLCVQHHCLLAVF